MKENRNTIIRLGVFAIAGLALLITTLFLIGNNQQLFGSKFILKTHFKNVGGLKKATMSGMQVSLSALLTMCSSLMTVLLK